MVPGCRSLHPPAEELDFAPALFQPPPAASPRLKAGADSAGRVRPAPPTKGARAQSLARSASPPAAAAARRFQISSACESVEKTEKQIRLFPGEPWAENHLATLWLPRHPPALLRTYESP